MEELSRPCIIIVHDTNQKLLDIAHQISLGIEEEGILFSIIEMQIEDVTSTAFKNSKKSKLGIAVAVDNKEIVIHNKNMKEKFPVLKYETLNKPTSLYRTIGKNAARLIKSEPFILNK